LPFFEVAVHQELGILPPSLEGNYDAPLLEEIIMFKEMPRGVTGSAALLPVVPTMVEQTGQMFATGVLNGTSGSQIHSQVKEPTSQPSRIHFMPALF